jgi:protein-S-isoprenylcysteine O-methyltransferase Ste14
MSDADDIRATARARLKARNDFKTMLTIFAVIIVLLLLIWLFSTGLPSNFTAYFWPVWPILGMAITAVFAGLDAYGITRRHITEADVDAEVARMNAPKTPPPAA